MSWVQYFAKNDSDYDGYVLSKDQLASLIEAYEYDTHSRFAVYRSRHNYNINIDDMQYISLKIFMIDPKASCESVQPHIPDDKVPFIQLGSCTLTCHQGGKKYKRKKPDISLMEDIPKSRKAVASKKLDCPSMIKIRRVLKFKGYKIEPGTSTRTAKESLSSLHEKLCDESTRKHINIEDRFYIYLPEASSHANHPVGEQADLNLGIDKRLSIYIQEKVMKDNICNSQEMLSLVNRYVQHTLFKYKPLPPSSNTRYWPRLKQIQNHMLMSVIKRRSNALDEAEVEKLVLKWREEYPDDLVELRVRPPKKIGRAKDSLNTTPHASNMFVGGKKKFLFIQQTAWQRKLLFLYGSELCIMVVYRPTKYALPLFFLVVPTNCMYIVVASFIIESESRSDIEEAISVIKVWNPGWHPKCFMADFSEDEINAIESSFKDTHTEIFLCDFHRLQSWNTWLSDKSTKVAGNKDAILELLINVAESCTEPDYRANLQYLRESDVWKSNPPLQRWFEKWISNSGKWVKLYRQERFFIVDTNEGMDALNAIIKNNFLRGFSLQKAQTVSELAKILTSKFLPFLFSKYCHSNLESINQIGTPHCYTFPFLNNRPSNFVQHIMGKLEESQEVHYFVHTDNFGTFHVVSSFSHIATEIQLNNGQGLPSCACIDWRKKHLPCKHILTGLSTGAFRWEDLPSTYTESPFLMNDGSFMIAHSKKDVYEENQSNGDCEVTIDEGDDALEMDEVEKFRSCLKRLDSLSYLSYNEEIFERLNLVLEKCEEDLSSVCPMKGPSPKRNQNWGKSEQVKGGKLQDKRGTKRKVDETLLEIQIHEPDMECLETIVIKPKIDQKQLYSTFLTL